MLWPKSPYFESPLVPQSQVTWKCYNVWIAGVFVFILDKQMDYGWHTGIIRKILKQLRRWRQTFCKYKVIFCSFAKSRRKCKRMWTIMFISNLGRPVKTSPKWICCFYHFTAGWRSGNNLQSVLVIHTLKRLQEKVYSGWYLFPYWN